MKRKILQKPHLPKRKNLIDAGTDQELPKDFNARIPAEWEKHQSTWIGWPHNIEDWPGKITPIPWVYGEIVRKIAAGEKVKILVENKEHQANALRILKDCHTDLNNVDFFKIKTNRGWLRDSFPAFVQIKSRQVLVAFKFNAWAKYDNYKNDSKIPEFISETLNLKQFKVKHKGSDVVLEGGSIDTNGSGTLLTTEECLLDHNIQVRNPGFTGKDYEEIFDKYLGIRKVIWLAKGITGDDTHGHVDDLCRFINKNSIVIVQGKNSKDENYYRLKENKERLEGETLEDGSSPEIIDIPMPSPLYFKGERLPASYANFYISNSFVLVPTFNDPNDKIALGVLSELFTDRIVAGIHSVDLIWGLGTIHCLTHEQPEAV
ncbi:MAG TPA: agmatine deiminase family protein [Ignavibacteriaceae bacterium]|nr:agmatine deiminase family protein [Ignavibacteriaceae bacterium]